jgi:4-hydroxy-3-methylbut-2-enyl diphosphate reductase
MRIILANPRGFCAGVERAIEVVERALGLDAGPVYVRHEIVHNRDVVESLRRRGAVFVDELSEVPRGAVVVFSAHGVAPSVYRDAVQRGLKLVDATCPLVTKVHLAVMAHARHHRSVIVIGHRDHPEVVGTIGYYEPAGDCELLVVENEVEAERVVVTDPRRVAYVTQTTLSVTDTASIVAALKRRFPGIVATREDDICAASENRQAATRVLAERCSAIVVVGAPHSSNSRRLVETAEQAGARTLFIEEASQLEPEWLCDLAAVGITSGASVPEDAVQRVVRRIREWYPGSSVESFGDVETLVFRLPRELARLGA